MTKETENPMVVDEYWNDGFKHYRKRAGVKK